MHGSLPSHKTWVVIRCFENAGVDSETGRVIERPGKKPVDWFELFIERVYENGFGGKDKDWKHLENNPVSGCSFHWKNLDEWRETRSRTEFWLNHVHSTDVYITCYTCSIRCPSIEVSKWIFGRKKSFIVAFHVDMQKCTLLAERRNGIERVF